MNRTATAGDRSFDRLHKAWQSQWEPSLALWSRFTQLAPPRWCLTEADEKEQSLSGSFAMIRLKDHAVVVSLRLVRRHRLEKFSREILAHEIGHHVLAPADLTDNGRLMARVRAGLPGKEHLAGFIANLYTDLLINDRLQRTAGLDMSGIYRTLGQKAVDSLWRLYMRIYEILWDLTSGTLTPAKIDSKLSGDAHLGARLVRVYAKEWLDGAGRFAALCLPYLLEDDGKGTMAVLSPILDAQRAGEGDAAPDGLAEIDSGEADGAIHPSLDPALNPETDESEEEGEGKGEEKAEADSMKSTPRPGGRETVGGRKNDYRSPVEYADLMKSLGVTIEEDAVIGRYYRERARPHLVPFPVRRMDRASDPIPEGEEPWDIGSPLGQIDWLGTVSRSPVVVPGITTVQQVLGQTPGGDPESRPVDLYLGIDCSGSMPNPRYQLSFPVLAGTIMALSALRAGARVMVALSGEPGEFSETDGFIRSEADLLKVLTGYLGTGFAFGIGRLKATFLSNKIPIERKTHILIITDSDIFSMLGQHSGWEIAEQALETAGGGGTYVLHKVDTECSDAARMQKQGWSVYGLTEWESLIRFAREFSRKRYGDGRNENRTPAP